MVDIFRYLIEWSFVQLFEFLSKISSNHHATYLPGYGRMVLKLYLGINAIFETLKARYFEKESNLHMLSSLTTAISVLISFILTSQSWRFQLLLYLFIESVVCSSFRFGSFRPSVTQTIKVVFGLLFLCFLSTCSIFDSISRCKTCQYYHMVFSLIKSSIFTLILTLLRNSPLVTLSAHLEPHNSYHKFFYTSES